jgi:hypothetical protein
VEFDDSEFDSPDMPDRFDETGPPAQTGHRAPMRLAAFRPVLLACTIAVAAGIALRPPSVEPDDPPLAAVTHAAPQHVTSVAVPGCPPSQVCRHYSPGMPALLARLVALDFPDTAATEFLAVDDVTGRTRDIVLAARLSRGLVLEDTASSRPPGHNALTPWVLVAVRDSTHPDHAARTMTSRRGDATVHLRIAVAPGSVPEGRGRADFVCTWCVRTAKQSHQASMISSELDRAYPGLIAAVAEGVQEVARSRALASFILGRHR